MIQRFLLAFSLHFWNLQKILRRMVYSLMVLEAIFSPQEPLKVKLSTKFQGVDFSISENSSAANVLTGLHENFKNPKNGPNRLQVMSNDEKHPKEIIKNFHRGLLTRSLPTTSILVVEGSKYRGHFRRP